jgi:hypothetical protein
MHLPVTIAEITTEWLNSVLADSDIGPISSHEIVEVMNGTATKICVDLRLEKGKTSATKRVWIKTGFEAHSHRIGQESVYAGEVHYYSKLAGTFDTRSPKCHFAQSEVQTGRSLLVLDDLTEIGASFSDPQVALSVDAVRRALATAAYIHAQSWMHPILNEDPWLAGGGAWIHSNVLDWMYSDENWEKRSSGPRFELLPSAWRNRDLLYATHKKLAYDWRIAADPYCMCHGDMHIGQTYSLPDGTMNFLDWQCVTKNSWAYDFSNLMVTSLAVEDRRAHEADLLRHYLEELRSHGIDAPHFDKAWELYRAFAFRGFGWLMVLTVMQSEANAVAISERVAAALVDLDTLDAIRRGPAGVR